ncbi:MAG: peptide deformylase [Planctomycetia bacterium]|nr:peptide deformylase [Planctomycetia bacterium]
MRDFFGADLLLRIIQYPHPTLRRPSKPLRRVDDELRTIVREMFNLMYEAKGIGLAANQVDLPYRLFVLNLKPEDAAPEDEQVFINPVLSQPKGMTEAEEGCLSLPGLYAQVKRPESVTINAYDLAGNEIRATAEGLYARAVQHETDHLDGVLFIDRLSPTAKLALKEPLEEFEIEFGGRRERGEIPDDARISARLTELEELRT